MAKNALLDKVDLINQLCKYNPRQINSYRLDIANGGYRLTQLVNDAGGETDISPRLKANEKSRSRRIAMEKELADG